MLREEMKEEFNIEIFDEISKEIDAKNIERSKENYLKIGRKIENEILFALKKERDEEDIVEKFSLLGILGEHNKQKEFFNGSMRTDTIIFALLGGATILTIFDFIINQHSFMTHIYSIIFLGIAMMLINKDLSILNRNEYIKVFKTSPYKKIKELLNNNEYEIYKFLKKNDMITNQNIYNYSDYLKKR